MAGGRVTGEGAAAEAGKPMPQDAEAQMASQGLGHKRWRRAGVAGGEVGVEALVQELVEGPCGRVAGLVLRRAHRCRRPA